MWFAAVMMIVSAVVLVFAYRLGSQWDRIVGAVKQFETIAGVVAGVVVVLAIAVWWLVRRRRRA